MKTLASRAALFGDTAPSDEHPVASLLNCGSEGVWRKPSGCSSGAADFRGQHLSG